MNFKRLIRFFCLILVFAQLGFLSATAQDTAPSGAVYHLKIEGEIEHGASAFLERGLRLAEADDAKALIIEINTPGGRLDSALAMKDSLLDSDVRIIAFVKRQAFSAGALIAVAATDLYLVEGGVIGAATPVIGDVTKKAPEKMVSGVRSAIASAAESRSRDPDIAQAMVDESIEIDGVTSEGKLLTLTAKEAAELDFSNGTVADFDALLHETGLADAPLRELKPTLIEQIVRFITSSMVTSLLLTIAMLALLLEFKAPGWGIAGLIALICYGLFFWGHHLAGLAGMEDLLLVGIGIVLLGLEIFVIPGTGIVGMLGVISLIGGLFLSLVGEVETTPQDMMLDAAGLVMLSFLAALILFVVLYREFFRGSMQESGLFFTGTFGREKDEENSVKRKPSAALKPGMKGTAHTDLRPAGTALFKKDKVSVVTEGDYVSHGSEIEILEVEGSRVVVRVVD